MVTLTLIPSSKVPFTEPDSGLITIQWYRYLFNLYNLTSTGGLVTSVTATSPLLSSGGIAPNISIPPATTSNGGYLTATDWNTFYSRAHSGANSDITSMSGLTGGISTPDYITFDTTPETVPTAAGSLYWDSADGIQTLNLIMTGGNAVQQIGEETYYRIKASSAITEGQVVMFTGTVGASGALQGAPATGLTASTASYIMGVATENIALNGWGYVTAFGLVRGINTTGGAEAWVDGQILYYDPTVAGGLTKTLPSAPNAKVQVCAVIYAASNGSLFIRPSFGGILGQYEGDVGFTSTAANDIIQRNAGNTTWVNVAPSTLSVGTATNLAGGATGSIPYQTASGTTGFLAAGTNGYVLTLSGGVPTWAASTGGVTSFQTSLSGLTPSTSSTGAITLAGTLGVASGGTGATTLTGYVKGTGTSALTASSTIPTTDLSGTITNAQLANSAITINGTSTSLGGSISVGTVTSVTGTAPVVSSGGATPAISMAAATSSVPGYLTSADWTTFNSKQDALVSGTNIKTVGGVSLLGSGDVGTIGATYGGTGLSTYATGDLIYASATNTLSKLAAGTNGYVLTLAAGVPTWAAASGGGATITNDTTTSSNIYPVSASATSGTFSTAYTSNAKYLYKPSTGELQASEMVATNGLFVNNQQVTADYTIPTGYNAMAVDLTVASGVTLTVSSGSTLVIL